MCCVSGLNDLLTMAIEYGGGLIVTALEGGRNIVHVDRVEGVGQVHQSGVMSVVS